MENTLNTKLTNSISENLKGYINNTIKGALDSMSNVLEKLVEMNHD